MLQKFLVVSEVKTKPKNSITYQMIRAWICSNFKMQLGLEMVLIYFLVKETITTQIRLGCEPIHLRK